MQVFITKYALTTGIITVEAKLSDTCESMISVSDGVSMTAYYHGEGKEWHRTYAGAWGKAEAMRTAALVALEKKRKKLESLNFKEIV